LHDRYPRDVFIGGNVNEVEIPGLEIDFDNHRVSFLWKPFLSRYLQDEAYVRSRRKSMGLCHRDNPTLAQLRAVTALADQAVTSGFFNGGTRTIGELDAELYARAWKVRLPEAYKEAMTKSSHSAFLWDLRVRISRNARRRQMLISLLKTQGSWSEGKRRYMDLFYLVWDEDGDRLLRNWQRELGGMFNSQFE
jgi:hypothetical protein